MSERTITSIAPRGTNRVLTEAMRDCAHACGITDGQWVLVVSTSAGQSRADVLAAIAAQLAEETQDTHDDEDPTP